MTTEQASAWLAERGVQYPPMTLQRYCKRGTLPATKPGRDWEITVETLKAFIKQPRRRGRRWPQKDQTDGNH